MNTKEHNLTYEGQEYWPDTIHRPVQYTLIGNEERGWQILRNGQQYATLGPGYTLVKTRYCGICTTDLKRHFLPFPLPQIIGHEIVGWRIQDNVRVAVEINASHFARRVFQTDNETCRYCTLESEEREPGINHQCPQRLTIGIDTLPGGLAPYLLAPVGALVPIPESVSFRTAALWEPLAAALHSVQVTPPQLNDTVAVIGPRKLGLLIVACLKYYRTVVMKDNTSFRILALSRHRNLLDLAVIVGADAGILIDDEFVSRIQNGNNSQFQFDIVFDTTGTSSGFQLALRLAKKLIHLKSTSGQTGFGIRHWTQLVVDEISILPFSKENLEFSWKTDRRERCNANVYVSPSVHPSFLQLANDNRTHRSFHQISIKEAVNKLDQSFKTLLDSGSLLPKFDLAIVSQPEEIDTVIRPLSGQNFSLVRPRGAILLFQNPGHNNQDSLPSSPNASSSLLWDAIVNRKVAIRTTRCGDAMASLKLLEDMPQLATRLCDIIFTHEFPLCDINNAFEIAKNSQTVVLSQHIKKATSHCTVTRTTLIFTKCV
jgi:threonine dehydrogenase-like Zn-dependent dehydrogenase